MKDLQTCIDEYSVQLSKGYIQTAYKGIMTFMSNMRTYLAGEYQDYVVSALYFGYMDMTYFACTPVGLKDKKLKIAIVYLHEPVRFEVWLGGSNRKIQTEFIELLSKKNIGKYKLSQTSPGIDSIIESVIVDKPDFSNQDELRRKIEDKTIEFIDDVITFLEFK